MPLDPHLLHRRNSRSVGTRPIRPDGVDKVTGRARYGADCNMRRASWSAVSCASPHAHARIKKIDTSKAEKLPGVKAVITAADLPDLTDGDRDMYDMLENCMAREKALYDGHAVAAVAADRRAHRQAGAEADQGRLRDAAARDRCRRGDEADGARCCTTTSSPKASSRSRQSHPTSPSAAEYRPWRCRSGLQAKPMSSSSDPSRPSRPTRAISSRMPASPSVGPDGTGELWVCTQGHFVYRNQCAQLLGMDVAKLRVTSSEIGGGFGGKTHVWAEPVALALSRKAEPAGQARHDPRGSVPCLGADQLDLDRRQDRRQEGRHHHRGLRRRCAIMRSLSRHRGPSSAP